MIKDSRKQNGSVLVVIIVTLIIVILGAFAFVAWNNFIKSKTTTNTSQQATSTTRTANPNEGYSIVKEWGVRFKNPDKLNSTKILQERVVSSDSNPQVSYAFTTARIKALGGACSSGIFSRTIILTRYADKPVATPDGELLNGSPIMGYYYVVGAPPAPCTVVDSDGVLKQGAAASPVELSDRITLKASIVTISQLK